MVGGGGVIVNKKYKVNWFFSVLFHAERVEGYTAQNIMNLEPFLSNVYQSIDGQSDYVWYPHMNRNWHRLDLEYLLFEIYQIFVWSSHCIAFPTIFAMEKFW